ncbi:MAG TPA: TIM44-like domain-containing protein [Burkholderiaceae bacterium]|nr:TIM44-like domain-containing protein [Burkholderiaceae bacterium]
MSRFLVVIARLSVAGVPFVAWAADGPPGTTPFPGTTAATPGANRGGPLVNGMHDIAVGLGLDSIARALGFGTGVAVGFLVALIIAVMVLPTAIVLGRRRLKSANVPAPLPDAPAMPRPGPGAPHNGSPHPVAQRLHIDGAASRQASLGQIGVPPGFDTAAFLTNAKLYFGKLQQAWGRGDLNALEQFTSAQLFTALTHELRARRDTGPRSTHVVSLDAQLLGIESSSREHIASVHFSGTLSVDGNNENIDEVWNLTRATSGQGGWVLAGIQQLN